MITAHRNIASLNSSKSRSGFTLVELIVVITIMVALASVITPAFNNLNKNQNLPNSVERLQSIIKIAKTKAAAENRYYWVGLQPEAAVKPTIPQNQNNIIVATYSTSRGQFEPYSANGEISSANTIADLPKEILNYLNLKKSGADVRLDGVSIRDISQTQFANSPRPKAALVQPSGAWICINPIGEVRISTSESTPLYDRKAPNIPNLKLGQGKSRGEVIINMWSEIGFVPSKIAGDKQASSLNQNQQAKAIALQISGLTGQTEIFSQTN